MAVDAKKHNDDWFVYSHGGTKKTNLLALSWIEKAQELGAGEILLTSMDKDCLLYTSPSPRDNR